eukprot:GHVN01079592.1.p1 GENE.GHVN01079592.1~~GHVN01079592.1.p1  ORF type:complete len:1365 (+),score=314.98 GHVN01079592.1:61-4155(+)
MFSVSPDQGSLWQKEPSYPFITNCCKDIDNTYFTFASNYRYCNDHQRQLVQSQQVHSRNTSLQSSSQITSFLFSGYCPVPATSAPPPSQESHVYSGTSAVHTQGVQPQPHLGMVQGHRTPHLTQVGDAEIASFSHPSLHSQSGSQSHPTQHSGCSLASHSRPNVLSSHPPPHSPQRPTHLHQHSLQWCDSRSTHLTTHPHMSDITTELFPHKQTQAHTRFDKQTVTQHTQMLRGGEAIRHGWFPLTPPQPPPLPTPLAQPRCIPQFNLTTKPLPSLNRTHITHFQNHPAGNHTQVQPPVNTNNLTKDNLLNPLSKQPTTSSTGTSLAFDWGDFIEEAIIVPSSSSTSDSLTTLISHQTKQPSNLSTVTNTIRTPSHKTHSRTHSRAFSRNYAQTSTRGSDERTVTRSPDTQMRAVPIPHSSSKLDKVSPTGSSDTLTQPGTFTHPTPQINRSGVKSAPPLPRSTTQPRTTQPSVTQNVVIQSSPPSSPSPPSNSFPSSTHCPPALHCHPGRAQLTSLPPTNPKGGTDIVRVDKQSNGRHQSNLGGSQQMLTKSLPHAHDNIQMVSESVCLHVTPAINSDDRFITSNKTAREPQLTSLTAPTSPTNRTISHKPGAHQPAWSSHLTLSHAPMHHPKSTNERTQRDNLTQSKASTDKVSSRKRISSVQLPLTLSQQPHCNHFRTISQVQSHSTSTDASTDVSRRQFFEHEKISTSPSTQAGIKPSTSLCNSDTLTQAGIEPSPSLCNSPPTVSLEKTQMSEMSAIDTKGKTAECGDVPDADTPTAPNKGYHDISRVNHTIPVSKYGTKNRSPRNSDAPSRTHISLTHGQHRLADSRGISAAVDCGDNVRGRRTMRDRWWVGRAGARQPSKPASSVKLKPSTQNSKLITAPVLQLVPVRSNRNIRDGHFVERVTAIQELPTSLPKEQLAEKDLMSETADTVADISTPAVANSSVDAYFNAWNNCAVKKHDESNMYDIDTRPITSKKADLQSNAKPTTVVNSATSSPSHAPKPSYFASSSFQVCSRSRGVYPVIPKTSHPTPSPHTVQIPKTADTVEHKGDLMKSKRRPQVNKSRSLSITNAGVNHNQQGSLDVAIPAHRKRVAGESSQAGGGVPSVSPLLQTTGDHQFEGVETHNDDGVDAVAVPVNEYHQDKTYDDTLNDAFKKCDSIDDLEVLPIVGPPIAPKPRPPSVPPISIARLRRYQALQSELHGLERDAVIDKEKAFLQFKKQLLIKCHRTQPYSKMSKERNRKGDGGDLASMQGKERKQRTSEDQCLATPLITQVTPHPARGFLKGSTQLLAEMSTGSSTQTGELNSGSEMNINKGQNRKVDMRHGFKCPPLPLYLLTPQYKRALLEAHYHAALQQLLAK